MKYADEFLRYMTTSDPKEGSLIAEPGWFQLWPLKQLDQQNLDYQIKEFAPGFLGFGSNGGGELLAFDCDGKIFMIPFVGMAACEARLIAQSWAEFVSLIER